MQRSFLSSIIFVVVSALFAPSSSYAHDEGPATDDFGLDASLKVLQRAVELTPAIVADDSQSERPEIVPTVMVGGKKIYLNSHFLELVKENVRFFYSELERDLPGCQVATLDQALKEAEDVVASGFLAKKLLEPLGTATSHIALSSADLGARLGNTAFGFKAAAEVGEGVLSKLVGGGGVHLFCTAIDAYILFGTRSLQVGMRNFKYSNAFNTTALRTIMYHGLVKSSLKRAQGRVAFEFEPFEVDEHELEEVDEEGAHRFWGWVKEGKRAKWVMEIAKRSRRAGKPLGENELSKIAQLDKKSFMGERMGRYLFLKARKWGNSKYLNGEKLMDKSLGYNVLWILSAQENVLHRSLLKTPGEAEDLLRKNAEALPNYPSDDVREGLAQEFSEGDPVQAEQLNRLLMDVDRIFDPSFDKRLRYLNTVLIESVLTGFIYKLLNEHVVMMYPRDGLWGYRLWRAFQIHWYTGRYAFYAHELADFMRMAAIQDRPEVLLRTKYEAMEALLRIFRHLKMTVPVEGENVQEWLSEVRVSNKNLKSFQPWKEKRSQYSLVPFVPWREKFAHWRFLPEVESFGTLAKWLVPRFPSRAPLCSDMDQMQKVL